MLCVLSRVRLFGIPWSVARQAPLSMDSPGKNTGVGCHALLQEIFLTQGSNLYLLHLYHWQADSLPLAPTGKPEDKHKRLENRSTSILYEYSIVLNLTHSFSKKKKKVPSQTYIFNTSFLQVSIWDFYFLYLEDF